MKQYLWVQDNFYSQARALRAEFERRFANPKETRSDRFVWDFWNVPGQYTLLRTPAEHFFPRSSYSNFLHHLGAWARSTLGCTAITPPWLSYYVEGCEQRLHSDVPHGPWAFVFSLSPTHPVFRGGETMLLRPEVLSYWQNFLEAKDRELGAFLHTIEPRFNRLVVFDPRIPHGVTRVEGTMDPRQARLVLHGWFADPKPCIEGALTARRVAPLLDEAVDKFVRAIAPLGAWHGVMSLRLEITPSGVIKNCRILADTLVPLTGDPADAQRIRRLLLAQIRALEFPRAETGSVITLPLIFR